MSYGSGKSGAALASYRRYGLGDGGVAPPITAGVPQLYPPTVRGLLAAYGVQITAPTSGRGPLSGYGRPSEAGRGRLGRISVTDPAAGIGRRLGQAQVAVVAGQILGGLIHTDTKDPQRLAQNLAWYNAAVKGDKVAYANLEAAGGVIPSAVPLGGSMAGSWATTTAVQDAASKVNQVGGAISAATGAAQQGAGAGINLLPSPGWVPNWTGDGTFVYLGPNGTGNVGYKVGSFDIPQAVYAAAHPGWYAQLLVKVAAQQGGTPPPSITVPEQAGVSDFFSSLVKGFTATPGGAAVVDQGVTTLTPAAKTALASKVGGTIVNNPAIVAGIVVGALALTATVAGRRGRR
jgi:hypothetical protein